MMLLHDDDRQDPLKRSDKQERINTITHALGLVLSAIAGGTLVTRAWQAGDTWRVIGCTAFVFSLLAVYAFSTLSHAVRDLRMKMWMRRWDQACIYVLIAATYTPFSLAFLREGVWQVLLAVEWLLAAWGFFAKILFAHRANAVSVRLYLLMGWLPIAAVVPLAGMLPVATFLWMLLGGCCYTFGTVFLVHDWRHDHFHAAWHLLVIAGSACHFYAIWRYVAVIGV